MRRLLESYLNRSSSVARHIPFEPIEAVDYLEHACKQSALIWERLPALSFYCARGDRAGCELSSNSTWPGTDQELEAAFRMLTLPKKITNDPAVLTRPTFGA
jgi:hypothetical protein